jgi:uncharacterized protein (DUF1015 family)
MAKIRPFEAVRPQPQLAKQVASKPYDVLNSAEAKQEAVGHAYSFYISQRVKLIYQKLLTSIVNKCTIWH